MLEMPGAYFWRHEYSSEELSCPIYLNGHGILAHLPEGPTTQAKQEW